MGRRWARGVSAPARKGSDLAALDRLVGRAVFDRAFREALLANPAAALMLEHVPLPLKRALAAIRSDSLARFALEALRAEGRLAQAAPPEERSRPAAG